MQCFWRKNKISLKNLCYYLFCCFFGIRLACQSEILKDTSKLDWHSVRIGEGILKYDLETYSIWKLGIWSHFWLLSMWNSDLSGRIEVEFDGNRLYWAFWPWQTGQTKDRSCYFDWSALSMTLSLLSLQSSLVSGASKEISV